jgi:hypothetical protein
MTLSFQDLLLSEITESRLHIPARTVPQRSISDVDAHLDTLTAKPRFVLTIDAEITATQIAKNLSVMSVAKHTHPQATFKAPPMTWSPTPRCTRWQTSTTSPD